MNTTRFALLTLLVACTGPQGPAGPDGIDGIIGEQGPVGDQGLLGEQGPDGGDARILYADETWSVDALVDRIVYVPAGITLTIDAGTQVDFIPEAGLLVDGTLVASGTSGSPIVFDIATLHTDATLGLQIGALATGTTIEFAEFLDVPITVSGNGLADFTSVLFDGSTVSVRDRTAAMTFDSCTFDNGPFETPFVEIDEIDVLVIDNCTFEDGYSGVNGVAAEAGTAITVTNTDFARLTRYGLVVGSNDNASPILLQDATFTDIGASPFGSSGTAVYTRVTVLNSGGGLSANAATFTDISLTNIGGSQCIRASNSTLTDITVDGCDGHGILLVLSDLSESEISNVGVAGVQITLGGTVTTTSITNAGDGIYFEGGQTGIARVTDTEIIDSVNIGAKGWTWNNTYPDATLVGCNITGSGGAAALLIESMDGTYVADNNGQTGVDTTEGGTDDGVFDTTGPQVDQLDTITNAQSSPVTTAGPSN